VLREIMGGDDNPSREEVVAELILFIARPCASSATSARTDS